MVSSVEEDILGIVHEIQLIKKRNNVLGLYFDFVVSGPTDVMRRIETEDHLQIRDGMVTPILGVRDRLIWKYDDDLTEIIVRRLT